MNPQLARSVGRVVGPVGIVTLPWISLVTVSLAGGGALVAPTYQLTDLGVLNMVMTRVRGATAKEKCPLKTLSAPAETSSSTTNCWRGTASPTSSPTR